MRDYSEKTRYTLARLHDATVEDGVTWHLLDGPFGATKVAYGQWVGSPRFTNTRLGRCDDCAVAFAWQGNRAKLQEMACPRCGRSLAQTQSGLARYPFLRIHNDSLPAIRRAKLIHDIAYLEARVAEYDQHEDEFIRRVFGDEHKKRLRVARESLAKLDTGKVSV